jgi:hypothetical protein
MKTVHKEQEKLTSLKAIKFTRKFNLQHLVEPEIQK